MIDVTKKMFENEALPDNLKELKNCALSSTYLRLSSRSYASNKMLLGMTNLKKAICYDPTLIEKNHKKILIRLVYWIHHLNIDNGNVLIKRIMNNLPEECESLKKRHRRIFYKLKIMLFMIRVMQNVKLQKLTEPVFINSISYIN
jgi:hypothetical protein